MKKERDELPEHWKAFAKKMTTCNECEKTKELLKEARGYIKILLDETDFTHDDLIHRIDVALDIKRTGG